MKILTLALFPAIQVTGFEKVMRSLFACILLSATAVFGQSKATLTVDLQHPKGKVSPLLYGLMTEEINYSCEGGLYAQLIRTPQFVSGWDQPAHWFLMPRGNAQLSFQLDKTVYRLSDRKLSLRVDIKQADTGNLAALGNEGYWGIPVGPSTTYRAFIYAKGQGVGTISASLVSDDTSRTFATAATDPIGDDWREYDLQLTTPPDAPTSVSNRFVLGFKWQNAASTSNSATVWSLKGASRAQTNSIDSPEAIMPSQSHIDNFGSDQVQHFGPLSINVVELKGNR